jgi:hypothetical protein
MELLSENLTYPQLQHTMEAHIHGLGKPTSPGEPILWMRTNKIISRHAFNKNAESHFLTKVNRKMVSAQEKYGTNPVYRWVQNK